MAAKSKTCAKCDQKVYPLDLFRALDSDWHKGCFRCTVCNSTLTLQNHFSSLSPVNGRKVPYCRVHRPAASEPPPAAVNLSAKPSTGPSKFLGSMASKPETPCPVCSKAVYPTERIRALRHNYHKACFRCSTCSMALSVKNFQSADERLYCYVHLPKVVQGLGKALAAASAVQYRGPRADGQSSPVGGSLSAAADQRQADEPFIDVTPVPGYLGKVRAHTVWTPEDETEHALAPGDQLLIVTKDNEHWWTGLLAGESKLFPLTHVDVVCEWTPPPARDSDAIGMALVTVPYMAAEDGELTLPADAIINVLAFDNEEWWTGRIGRSTGLFPSMYVQLLESAPTADAASSSAALTTAAGAVATGTVVNPWTAQDEGELSVAVGDEVNVLSFDNDDWWSAIVNGATGLVPAMCIALASSNTAAAPSAATAVSAGAAAHGIGSIRAVYSYASQDSDELSLAPGDVITVFEQTSSEWWTGACRQREGLFPLSHVAMDSWTPAPAGGSAAAAAAGGGRTVTAAWAYAANADDELSFPAQAVITVISEDNDEWWTGVYAGRQALFPTAFIKQ